MQGKAKELVIMPGLSGGRPAGTYVASFELYGNPRDIVDWYAGISKYDKVKIEAKKVTFKRSHDANAYYWVLVTQLAKKMQVSNARQHNIQLRKYGELDFIGGRLIQVNIPDTDEAENQALESNHFHIMPTNETYYEGELRYRVYNLLRGSHTYTSEEMSRLISNTVEECKEQGIETLTPDELERMCYLWTPSSK